MQSNVDVKFEIEDSSSNSDEGMKEEGEDEDRE